MSQSRNEINSNLINNLNMDVLVDLLEMPTVPGTQKIIDPDNNRAIELAVEALECCPYYIDALILKVKKTTRYFQTGQMARANFYFIEMIDLLDLYIQLISKIHQTIKAPSTTIISTGKTIHQLQIHMLSVLKAITTAKKKNDIIMLCDLLEYELLDNLTQWKIDAIPKLKNIKNN